jgi:hypothetical protein
MSGGSDFHDKLREFVTAAFDSIASDAAKERTIRVAGFWSRQADGSYAQAVREIPGWELAAATITPKKKARQ